MATTRANIVITCNAKQAQQVLKNMRTNLKVMEKALANLVQSGQGGSAVARDLAQNIELTRRALRDNENNLERVKRVLNDLKGATLGQLKGALRDVAKEMNNATGDNKKLLEIKNKYKLINDEIQRRNKLTGMGTAALNGQMSMMKRHLQNLVSYMGMYAVLDTIKTKLMGVYQMNFKLSDQLADIRKVSGLAMQDINGLSRNLAKLDTRTTLEDLNKIAYEGAKLGIPDKYGVKGLEQFTVAANQVNVALREELGDEALTALSKLVEVMGLIPKLGVEQSMLKTASAMFTLASSSTSSADQIVEFSKRLTGVARTAGITTDQLLALGSASDSMGLAAEVSSTAFSQLIVAMQQRHNLIEQAMGISPGTINNLFQAGKMMDAIVLLFEKMQEKGNLNAMKGIFDSLHLNGQRAVGVFSTMAKNVDMLKDQLKVGEEAFKEGTAVTREYEIQQQTAQALMERANNIWQKAFVNPDGVEMVHEMAQAWYDLSKSLTTNSVYMGMMHTLFNMMTFSIKMLIALLPSLINGLMLYGVVGAIGGVVGALRTAGSLTVALTTAWKGLNLAMKSSIIGFVASALLTLGMYLYDCAQKAQQATKFMDGFSMSLTGVNAEIAVATDEARRYKEAIDKAAMGTRERAAAIENFSKKFGRYYKTMLTEKSTALDIAKAYDEVCRALKGKILLEAKQKDIEAQINPRVRYEANKVYAYDQTAKGTEFSQYNGAWLEAFISDQKKAGKTNKQTYDELVKKLGVDKNFTKYTKSNIRSAWAGRSTDANADETLAFFKENEAYNRKQKNNGSAALRADHYRALELLSLGAKVIEQSYSIDKAWSLINEKYEPMKAEMDAAQKSLDTYETETGDMGELNENATDKSAFKDESERKKRLQKELSDRQEEGKAIIDNVRNYYERQLTQIKEFANDKDIDDAMAEQFTLGMKARMNTALAQVRLAITGVENHWDTFKETMAGDMREGFDENGTNLSADLLKDILGTDPNEVYKSIVEVSKALGKSPTAEIDAVYRRGSENEGKVEDIRTKQRKERNKRLLDNDYTGKTDNEYLNSMETLGFYSLTERQTGDAMAAQTVKHMRKPVDDKDPNYEMYNRLSGQAASWEKEAERRTSAIDTAFQNVREHITELYSIVDVASEGGKNRLMSILFGDDWQNTAQDLLPVLQMTGDDVKVFYDELLKYYDAYTVAEKKRDDERKKVIDYRLENSEVYKEISDRQEELDMTKSGVSQYGVNAQRRETEGGTVPRYDVYGTDAFINSFGADPEVEAYRLKMAAAQAYYDYLKANGATQAQLAEQERKVLSAESEYAKATANQTKQRMEDILTLLSPIEDFGTSVGEAFATMTEDAEAGRKALKAAIGDMINAFLKQTITMTQEYIKRRILQQSNDYITSRQMKKSSDEQIQIEEDTQTGMRRAIRMGNDGKKQILTNWSKDSLGVIEQQAKKELAVEEDKQSDVNKVAQKGGKKKENVLKKVWNSIFKKKKKEDNKEVKQEESTQDEMTQVQEQAGDVRQNVAGTVEEGIGDITAQVGQETLQTQKAQATESVQTEASETTAKTTMGIASGASKIIGSLGWWGIPLVAVITALLNGLLSFAMSKVSSLFGGGESSTDTGTTTKLVTGMLTYDKGNVQAFSGVQTGDTYPVVGNDGNVYAAKDAGELSTGLVKDPITALVNGQPALVAEKGPEMVIGRETTAAMMMNRPDLLNEIVKFDRSRSGMHYRAYDAGNVAEFASSVSGGNSPLTPTDTQQLRDTISSLSLVLSQIQQNGIQARINKYGRGGVTEAAASGSAFMKKNSGDRLWSRG